MITSVRPFFFMENENSAKITPAKGKDFTDKKWDINTGVMGN